MKRLFDTSVGQVELELDADVDAFLFLSLFDSEGVVAKSFGADWAHADVAAMLSTLGLPPSEARSVAGRFTAAAHAEGHPEPDPAVARRVEALASIGLVLLVLLAALGIWAMVAWLT